MLLATAPWAATASRSPLSDGWPAARRSRVAQGLSPQPWPTDRAAAARRWPALPNGAGDMSSGSATASSTGKDDAVGPVRRPAAAAGQRHGAAQCAGRPGAAAVAAAGRARRVRAVGLARPEGGAGPQASPARHRPTTAGWSPARTMTIAAGETTGQASHASAGRAAQPHRPAGDRGPGSAGAACCSTNAGAGGRSASSAGAKPAPASRCSAISYYLERALAPLHELRRGSIDDAAAAQARGDRAGRRGHAVASPSAEAEDLGREGRRAAALRRQLAGAEAGRAAAGAAARRRPRDRRRHVLGRSRCSWRRSRSTSPFAGLAVPDDVTVRRQVLAEPDLDLGDKTWARLADGTPLVTGEHRGEGWLVLVHTTANADWSTLALSGLFVRDAAAAGRPQPGRRRRPAAEQALPPLRDARRARPAGDAAGRRRGRDRRDGDRRRRGRPAPSARLLRPRRHPARAQPLAGDHQRADAAAAPAGRRHARPALPRPRKSTSARRCSAPCSRCWRSISSIALALRGLLRLAAHGAAGRRGARCCWCRRPRGGQDADARAMPTASRIDAATPDPPRLCADRQPRGRRHQRAPA